MRSLTYSSNAAKYIGIEKALEGLQAVKTMFPRASVKIVDSIDQRIGRLRSRLPATTFSRRYWV
jgi:hypothetical protein